MDTTGVSSTSVPVGTEDVIATGLDMDVDIELDQAQCSDLSSYVGSSAPFSPQSPAPTPGSEFPYSLVSSRDEDMGWSDSLSGDVESLQRPVSPPMRALQTTEEEESSRVLSQDGFILERTTPAPGMPQQLPVFLMPFQGSLTTVPANGQCAYVALYATTTSTMETKVEFTSQVVRGANAIKRCVYTMMMANLANDVECNVVDPRRELTRLYPTQPAPTDLAVATAALYTHHSQERARSVNASVPLAFWAGPEVLRAMAQYLREPLFVLDVDQANDAHVQRYFYQDYTLPNGDIHETGCGGAMDDATAK
ncbi:hypothetical protein PF010_g26334 [Phytophthora fragariae]|uniref:OTU domain-containing protein n=1 Tax=Phytophthora fragariae TaxID=53985 RepID=A0A6A3HUD1_9STRA|nr:hypothetical protein PF011_g25673 [Phytophthora fragariae]KAE9070296.1 hypothetical protein PF010_g26334 [Phytophthora fragariae]KAE9177506.1 hypothetical protein PF004_g25758 [Phytophthora fragariae]KAE9287989.1 hypothetical protein PF008_g26265 [Phytophthora fragariae]